MAKSVKARIAYTGKALENGEMNVRELAPALLAFADLVKFANKEIGSESKIKVLMNQDSIKRGSFDLTFLLDTTMLQDVTNLVGMAKHNGLSDLMLALGWTVTIADVPGKVQGIFQFIKQVGDRIIKSVDTNAENDVEVTLDDGDKIRTTQNVINIYGNENCRIAIERIISPVEAENGIDGFELRNPDTGNKEAIERVSKDEAYLFKASMPGKIEEELKTETQELWVQIISPNFGDGKWKFDSGGGFLWATIQDDEFLQKIENHKLRFGKGDMLLITYYTRQQVKNGKLTSDNIVTKVKKVKRGMEQVPLPL